MKPSDAIRLLAFAALLAATPGCGCRRNAPAPSAPESAALPDAGEVDYVKDRLNDPEYVAKLDSLAGEKRAAMKRCAAARREYAAAVAAGASPSALAVHSNALAAAGANLKAVEDKARTTVGAQIQKGLRLNEISRKQREAKGSEL